MTKTNFSRYSPAEWLDEGGVATLIDWIEQLPTMVRRAPWKALAIATGVNVAVAASCYTCPSTHLTTGPLREYEAFVDAPLTREQRADHDFVSSSYWTKSVADYVQTLEPLPPEDDDGQIPDPIV